MKPIHIPADSTVALHVFGVEIRVILNAGATGGSLGLFQEITPPQVGPPLHVHHHEDEFFRIIEGRYRFRIGTDDLEAGAGDTLVAPRGVPHCFLNVGDGPGTIFMGLTPGGFEGFFGRVAADSLQVPADMPRIAQLGSEFGLEFLGPNPLASP